MGLGSLSSKTVKRVHDQAELGRAPPRGALNNLHTSSSLLVGFLLILTTVLRPLLPVLVPGHISGALAIVISLRCVPPPPHTAHAMRDIALSLMRCAGCVVCTRRSGGCWGLFAPPTKSGKPANVGHFLLSHSVNAACSPWVGSTQVGCPLTVA